MSDKIQKVSLNDIYCPACGADTLTVHKDDCPAGNPDPVRDRIAQTHGRDFVDFVDAINAPYAPRVK